MNSIPFEMPPGDVDPRQASPRFFYPLATIKCAGSPIFRTQDARDFACLLDVEPDVLSWSCVGVELTYGDETYVTDFVVTGTAVVEEIESIRDEMSDEARVFFGWRPYAEKWAFPNPIWSELRQAFQEGRDDAERTPERARCPVFPLSSFSEIWG
ncbi:hypothetical protein [Neorhizobium sp. P12A]|uniref:hypothetical protein n=1 Tax=Neorhizobium sp. P12A TaxID=2268027 RepID=UPI00165DE946|nr:hypothetical protein [Neorhizobium sp. P12A]